MRTRSEVNSEYAQSSDLQVDLSSRNKKLSRSTSYALFLENFVRFINGLLSTSAMYMNEY